jgi:nucleoside phosphorylase
MADLRRPRNRSDFSIAIICALPVEADAVEACFDEFWEKDETYGKAPGDPNAYTTGRIGEHNVVLAHLPGMAKINAANVSAYF